MSKKNPVLYKRLYRKPEIKTIEVRHLKLFAPASLFGDSELLAACSPPECSGNFSSCNVGGSCFDSCCV